MLTRYLLLLAAWLLTLSAVAQKTLTLRSPGGQLTYRFHLTPQAPVYAVDFHGKPVVAESPLGLEFQQGGAWGAGLRQLSARQLAVDEYYSLPVGKASRIRNHYRQLTIALQETAGAGRQITLVVRAYDDGLAFRYEFPAQKNWPDYVLTAENSTFRLAGDPTVLTLFRENYLTSHEGFYSRLPLSTVRADTLMDLPTLFERPGGPYLAITEAALRDYASMYLTKHEGVLISRLSPLPGQTDVKVRAALPHCSPWRVLLLGERMGALLESNIITSLNEPPSQDFS